MSIIFAEMSTTIEPANFNASERELISELKLHFTTELRSQIAQIRVGDKCLDLPEVAASLFAEAVESLAAGRAITLVTERDEDEISPQEAAGILGVSRPFASKLFDQGAIPCRRVGTHRRALRRDVLAYREREREARKRVLDELAAEGQSLELGY